jgi:hypothetical protein
MQQRAPVRGAKPASLGRDLTRGNMASRQRLLIIVGERANHFDDLRAALMDEHDLQSILECEMVERLAVILWRLRRVPSFEVAILDARHQQVWNQKDYDRLPEPRTRKRRRNRTRRKPTGERQLT